MPNDVFVKVLRVAVVLLVADLLLSGGSMTHVLLCIATNDAAGLVAV